MNVLFVSNLYPPHALGGYERLCYDMAQDFIQRGHRVRVLTSTWNGGVERSSEPDVLRELLLLASDHNLYEPLVASPEEIQRRNAHNIEVATQTLRSIRPDIIFAWNLYFLDGSLLRALVQQPIPLALLLTDNWLIASEYPEFIHSFFRDCVHGPAGFRDWIAQPEPAPRHPVRSRPFLRFPAIPLRALARRLPLRFRQHVLAARLQSMLRPLLRTHSFSPRPHDPTDTTAGAPPPRELALSANAIYGSLFMRRLYHRAGFRFGQETVIHNGVRQPPSSAEPLRDYGIPYSRGSVQLLCAGRLVDVKGIRTAVECLHLLHTERPGQDIHLTLLGNQSDQEYVAQLRADINRLGLHSVVHFRDSVPEAELPSLFRSFDIYLFPSLYEPFSLTLIHALAAGIPTVASDAGGNPEIVSSYKTGLLFRAGDANHLANQVGLLIDDVSLRRTISRGGSAVASEFRFQRMVDATIGYLEQILRSQPAETYPPSTRS